MPGTSLSVCGLIERHPQFSAAVRTNSAQVDRQEMALRVLDTAIAGYQLEDLSNRLRRS